MSENPPDEIIGNGVPAEIPSEQDLPGRGVGEDLYEKRIPELKEFKAAGQEKDRSGDGQMSGRIQDELKEQAPEDDKDDLDQIDGDPLRPGPLVELHGDADGNQNQEKPEQS